MISLPLQDYILIRSDSAVSSVIQNESGWLDLSGYQDVVAFLEVNEFSGATTIQISYQTSPTKDGELFVNMTSAVTLAAGLTVTKMLKASASVPVGRFVRWQLSASGITGSWDAMFRVWLAANLATQRGRVPVDSGTRGRMLPAEPSPPLAQRAALMPASTNVINANPGVGSPFRM